MKKVTVDEVLEVLKDVLETHEGAIERIENFVRLMDEKDRRKSLLFAIYSVSDARLAELTTPKFEKDMIAAIKRLRAEEESK